MQPPIRNTHKHLKNGCSLECAAILGKRRWGTRDSMEASDAGLTLVTAPAWRHHPDPLGVPRGGESRREVRGFERRLYLLFVAATLSISPSLIRGRITIDSRRMFYDPCV